jgi:general secretion pathway protein N
VKKQVVLYVVFGLVFYLLFLIIEMPAAWFAWGLNQYSHGAVRLDPITGSLWHGKGRLVIYYPQNLPHDLGETEWSINPFWLLTGRVQLTLQSNTPERQIKTTLGIAKGSLSIKDTDAAFPATFINQLYPPSTLISPQGQVRLRTSSLVFSQQNLEGSAMLEWQNAGSSLSSVQPLGDYRLEITGGGNAANLKLTTVSGPLALDGQGKWQIQDGQLQINGTAVPRERAVELEPLLILLGPDQGNGRRALTLAMRLPISQ